MAIIGRIVRSVPYLDVLASLHSAFGGARSLKSTGLGQVRWITGMPAESIPDRLRPRQRLQTSRADLWRRMRPRVL